MPITYPEFVGSQNYYLGAQVHLTASPGTHRFILIRSGGLELTPPLSPVTSSFYNDGTLPSTWIAPTEAGFWAEVDAGKYKPWKATGVYAPGEKVAYGNKAWISLHYVPEAVTPGSLFQYWNGQENSEGWWLEVDADHSLWETTVDQSPGTVTQSDLDAIMQKLDRIDATTSVSHLDIKAFMVSQNAMMDKVDEILRIVRCLYDFPNHQDLLNAIVKINGSASSGSSSGLAAFSNMAVPTDGGLTTLALISNDSRNPMYLDVLIQGSAETSSQGARSIPLYGELVSSSGSNIIRLVMELVQVGEGFAGIARARVVVQPGGSFNIGLPGGLGLGYTRPWCTVAEKWAL